MLKPMAAVLAALFLLGGIQAPAQAQSPLVAGAIGAGVGIVLDRTILGQGRSVCARGFYRAADRNCYPRVQRPYISRATGDYETSTPSSPETNEAPATITYGQPYPHHRGDHKLLGCRRVFDNSTVRIVPASECGK